MLDRLDAERQLLEARFAARKLAGDTTAPASPQTAIARQIEQYLDTGMGACYLATPAFASLVADALRYFDEKRYRLFTWCIMPNHLPVIVQPFAGYPLLPGTTACRLACSDEERERFTRSLNSAIEPGGTYLMLCFSEKEPIDWGGPRRVTMEEIRKTFQEGWKVNYIKDARFETAYHTDGGRGWLSSLTRTPT